MGELDRARIIPRMRINLVTPFAEKDAAKALGRQKVLVHR
jgi:hypothetical protein